VGYLSRDDAPARPYNAGPTIPTPEAQCQGISEFHYAIMPHRGGWQRGRVWIQAHEHLAPPMLWEVPRSAGKLRKQFSLVKVGPPGVVLSAVKRAESKDALVVRVYNTTARSLTARVKLGLAMRSARRVNLNEQPIRGGFAEMSGDTVRVRLRRFEIATLAIRLRRALPS
jgi:alpha-mannosidase